MPQPPKRRHKIRRVKISNLSGLAHIRLSEKVIVARSGLIPSSRTDAIKPPQGLTVRQLERWHSGLEVRARLTASEQLRFAEAMRHGDIRVQ